MTDFAELRVRMVDGQIRPNNVTSHRLISAFLETPREAFVPAAMRELAYIDADIPLGEGGRVLIQPMVLARLIQEIDVAATDKVLEVGTASGYGAALLSPLAASVVALESDPALAAMARRALSSHANVSVVEGALDAGFAAGGPYDAIIVTGAIEVFPEKLAAQLADGGRLILVDGRGNAAEAVLYRKSGGTLSGRPLFNASLPVLPGMETRPAFAF